MTISMLLFFPVVVMVLPQGGMSWIVFSHSNNNMWFIPRLGCCSTYCRCNSSSRRKCCLPATTISNSQEKNETKGDSSQLPQQQQQALLLGDFDRETDPVRRKALRRDMIRSIQASFYAQPTTQPDATSNKDAAVVVVAGDDFHDFAVASNKMYMIETAAATGMHFPPLDRDGVWHNLPLWCVPWVEVPGRTNVLSVHDPVYTHMFERLLRMKNSNSNDPLSSTPPDCFFGHVHRPTSDNNNRRQRQELIAWNDDNATTTIGLGTLMRITDFRRLDSGSSSSKTSTLLLLVQAMDRFVVHTVVQSLPYGVAHVQLLPDREEFLSFEPETPPSTASSDNTNNSSSTLDCTVEISSVEDTLLATDYPTKESIVSSARAQASRTSWTDWYPIEFEKTHLPLPNARRDEYMPVSALTGSTLRSILPLAAFGPFSQSPPTIPVAAPQKPVADSISRPYGGSDIDSIEQTKTSPNSKSSSDLETTTLELRLLEAGVLNIVPVPDVLLHLSLEELEQRVWQILNNLAKASAATAKKDSFTISPILLGLLPYKQDWWDDFILQQLADDLHATINVSNISSSEVVHSFDAKFIRLPSWYPSARRQKRLSYTAAQLLEHIPSVAADPNRLTALRQQLLQIPRYATKTQDLPVVSRTTE